MEAVVDARRYPVLATLVWSRADVMLTEREALYLYESARGQIDPATMEPHERELFERLVREVGGGVFLD